MNRQIQIFVLLNLFLSFGFCATVSYGQSDELLRNLDGYRIDQDKELQAVASRTLTWLTGSSEQNDYISVGRLANFFGFVKFRVSSGHSLTRSSAGQETFSLLSLPQRDLLFDLLDNQNEPFGRAVALRIEMNRMLEKLRSGEHVDQESFLKIGEQYGEAEVELGRVIAESFGEIYESTNSAQRSDLKTIRGRYVSGKAGKFNMPGEARKSMGGRGDLDNQELWNLASRFLTWVTGKPEDNDFETVGKPSQHFGFVSLRVESGHSVKRGVVANEVLELLSKEQRLVLEEVVRDEASLFQDFLVARSKINREFERALAGEPIRPELTSALGREIGRIEAEMTWGQAQGILSIRNLLSIEQAEALLTMRGKYVPNEMPNLPESVLDSETESHAAWQISRGRQLFAQCALCHVAPERGRAVGPNLDGIVDRNVASDDQYTNYSPAMIGYGQEAVTWNEVRLDSYLKSPRSHVPGTTMGFDGIDDDGDRLALISYLKTRQDRSESEEPTVNDLNDRYPNIVLLVADDQDWAGLSLRMDPDEPRSASSFIQTPRIAEWAKTGSLLTRGYAPSPVCSPTRASIQTGISPAKLRWTKAAPTVDGRELEPAKSARDLDTDYVTIGELLKEAGFTTAHFGKWHLEGGGPEAHGYDQSDGATGNQDAIPHTDPNPVDIFGMTERAETFVRNAVESEQPFFLQMSYHALHHPENAMRETIEKYRKLNPRANEKEIQRAALAENMDEGVGRLLDLLSELDLMSNTYIFYTSDNGGGGSGGRNALLSGGKGGLGEGGIRVPYIASGPGIAPGSVIRTPVVGFDFYPTFAAMAGMGNELPTDLEGGNLLPLLQGQSDHVQRSGEGIVFHFPHYQGKSTPQSALVIDSWKLIYEYESKRVQLFDLDSDPSEEHNLAEDRTELVDTMLKELQSQLEAVDALLPEESVTDEIKPEDAKIRKRDRKKEP